MTIFTELCNIATNDSTPFEVAVTLDTAIKQTEEGKLCESLIKQYNEGLITLAEFRRSFITAALS